MLDVNSTEAQRKRGKKKRERAQGLFRTPASHAPMWLLSSHRVKVTRREGPKKKKKQDPVLQQNEHAMSITHSSKNVWKRHSYHWKKKKKKKTAMVVLPFFFSHTFFQVGRKRLNCESLVDSTRPSFFFFSLLPEDLLFTTIVQLLLFFFFFLNTI